MGCECEHFNLEEPYYDCLLYTSNVIGTVDNETEDPTLQYYLEQALAVRAFAYFTLIQLYQFNYKGQDVYKRQVLVLIRRVHIGIVILRKDAFVTLGTIRRTQFQVVQLRVCTLHECFVGNTPRGIYRPEITPAV